MADGRRRDHTAFGALVAVVAAGVFVAASVGLNVQTILDRRALAPQVAQCQPNDPWACEARKLEAQIRSAGAGEAAADFAGWALALDAFGLLGLAAAAIYARRAWRASQGSAERSAAAFSATREGEERRLRAYVTLEDLVLTPHAAHGAIDKLELRIRWKNCGQTPARNLVAYSVVTTRESLPDNFDFPDAPEGAAVPSPSRTATRGPGQEVAQTHLIWPQSIANIRDNGHRLYLWGWVEYDDLFPGSPRRRSEFAAQGKVVETADDQPPRLILELLSRFNGIDDDCFRKPVTGRGR